MGSNKNNKLAPHVSNLCEREFFAYLPCLFRKPMFLHSDQATITYAPLPHHPPPHRPIGLVLHMTQQSYITHPHFGPVWVATLHVCKQKRWRIFPAALPDLSIRKSSIYCDCNDVTVLCCIQYSEQRRALLILSLFYNPFIVNRYLIS